MKQATYLLLSVSLILATQVLFAQTPVVEWQKCLGGKNGDYANSIIQTSDGGYIAAGYTEGPDNGDVMGYHGNSEVNDYWVVKMNSTGNIQWQKCLGGLFAETGGFIRQTSDGGYIVAGSSASVDCSLTGNHGGLDYWIVKLESDGDVEWQKMIGGNKNDYAWSIDLTIDGGYILAGHSESLTGDVTGNHGNRDFWVVKINSSGVLQWQKSLGGSADDFAYSVKATSDGGFIVAGTTESNDGDVTFNHGKGDFWIVKLDNSGSLQWQKSFGGADLDEAWCIQTAMDGGYIVAGRTRSNEGDVSGNHIGINSGFEDYWVVKLNSTGALQWQKCYGGDKNDIAYFIQSTADGGYLVAGSAESSNGDVTCNSGITDMWLLKINNLGVIQWQKSLGGNSFDQATCIQPTNEGGFIVSGSTCSSDISGWHPHSTFQGTCADFWIIKLSVSAAIPPNPIVIIDPASATICTGGPSTLTANTRFAGTNPAYRWEKNGITVGGNSSSYTANDLANNDIVKCFVTSGGPCETISLQASDVVTIKVNPNIIQPSVSITADNTIVCPCTTVNFKASVSNGGSSPQYQWYVNNIYTGVDKDIFISNNLKDGDVVTCVYKDNASCIAGGSVLSNTITITAASGQSPTVNITATNNNSCSGSTISFNAATVNAGANPTYQWKINGVNTGSNSNIFTTTTLVNGDIVNCTISSDPLFVCITPTLVTSNNIVVSRTNSLTPGISIASSANNICAGSQVTFTATPANAGANPIYQWSINGINTGTNSNTFISSALLDADIVSCKITADPAFTCATTTIANSNTISISVNNTAVSSISISVSGNDVCKGSPVSFTAIPINGGSSPTYQWKLNNTNVGGNTAVFSSSNLSNGDQVYCEMTAGANACTNSNSSSNIIAMIVNDALAISIVPADTIVSSGSQIQLNASFTGTISSYQWTPVNLLENPLSLTPKTTSLISTTTYTLTATSNKGCIASKSVTIKIQLPVIMPSAFTPNNDGLNDVFRIPKDVSILLDEFSIYDRWGIKIFSTKNITEGWKGNINGKPASTGVFVYMIKGSNEKGSIFLSGSFTLIR